jgi:hypothetical protein
MTTKVGGRIGKRRRRDGGGEDRLGRNGKRRRAGNGVSVKNSGQLG